MWRYGRGLLLCEIPKVVGYFLFVILCPTIYKISPSYPQTQNQSNALYHWGRLAAAAIRPCATFSFKSWGAFKGKARRGRVNRTSLNPIWNPCCLWLLRFRSQFGQWAGFCVQEGRMEVGSILLLWEVRRLTTLLQMKTGTSREWPLKGWIGDCQTINKQTNYN